MSVSDNSIIPNSLRAQVLSIITNCSAVISRIESTLQTFGGKSGAVKWATSGKPEVDAIRISLEAHRGALSLMLDLVAVSYSKAIKNDTAIVRADILDIREDTTHIPHMLEELKNL